MNTKMKSQTSVNQIVGLLADLHPARIVELTGREPYLSLMLSTRRQPVVIDRFRGVGNIQVWGGYTVSFYRFCERHKRQIAQACGCLDCRQALVANSSLTCERALDWVASLVQLTGLEHFEVVEQVRRFRVQPTDEQMPDGPDVLYYADLPPTDQESTHSLIRLLGSTAGQFAILTPEPEPYTSALPILETETVGWPRHSGETSKLTLLIGSRNGPDYRESR